MGARVPLVLFEEDKVGVGVSRFCEERTKDGRILGTHPVRTFLENVAVLSGKFSKLVP